MTARHFHVTLHHYRSRPRSNAPQHCRTTPRRA